MDNITVIVEDYPQEITVQVTTTGITVDQANQIVANTQKVSDINHVAIELFNVDNTSDLNKPVSTATAQLVNTEQSSRIAADNTLQSNINNEQTARISADNDLQAQITANDSDISSNASNIAQEITNRTNADNTLQSNIDSEQSSRISADSTLQTNIDNLDTRVTVNDAKVGITTEQANDIVANNAKVGITQQQSDDIVSNNSKVGITAQQSADITANNAKVSDINHVTADLPNVDNTSDINKPVSTATQSALDLKVDITDATITTTNIFKSVSFTMDFSDRVIADSGTIESRECVMNEYLKILN